MPKYIYSILIISNLFSQVDYYTQIQPIFDNNCISCHIDGGAYFGDLDLSSYPLVIEGGSSGNTIIPFDHSSSELFNRITLDESDNDFMPQYGMALSQSEIDLIAQWIDEGALETPTDVDCYAEDGTEGVEIWGVCYSIQNTTAFGWPISIPDTATYLPEKLFSLINLITLDISYSNISEPIPPEIGALVNLTRLNLSNNQISGEIPSEIGNLVNLASLNIGSNQFSGNIPIEIFNLSNLKGGIEPAFIGTVFYPGLDLSNNLLTGAIPEHLGLLENLKSVDFSYNQLTGSLPAGLYSLDSLQSLNLSNNLLSGEVSVEIGNLSQLQGITTYAHNSMTHYDALNLSNNSFAGLLPESICDLPLNWDDNYMDEYQGFDISDNQFCAPFPNCVQPFAGSQDTTNCSPTTFSIEGRWIMPMSEGGAGNTMYEFLDGLRYTYYCEDDNGCDSTYWNSLDTSDALPTINPYIVNENTLSIDLHFGNTATYTMGFRCDGQVVDFYYDEDDNWEGLHSTMFRVEFDLSECEELNSYTIEGRWLWNYGGYTATPSTMYEYLDGLRYTYYCTGNTGCDSTYWSSLDTSDAIPNPDSYIFINDTLTFDGSSGSFIDFGCDGNIILSDDNIVLWRVGLDTSECEDIQLALSSAISPPETFRLHQNYPNPFNPLTSLSYDLLEDSYVRITIYDLLGKVINNLVQSNQSSGYKTIQWNATNNQGQLVSAGVYLYSIEAGEFRQTKKMILLK